MKEKLKQLKPILNMIQVALIVLFIIVATQTTTKAAQPMVAAGGHHTVGLKSNGTVVAVGRNYWSELNVSFWTDIVQVAAGYNDTVG